MRELEARFADELVVIGVHSGKFRAERVTANIAAAAQRLRVEHAVVNDRQFRIWRAYGVGAWPTAVLRLNGASMFTSGTREPGPDFQDGLDWIHVGRPLTMRDLRGKLVLLDFWTYG